MMPWLVSHMSASPGRSQQQVCACAVKHGKRMQDLPEGAQAICELAIIPGEPPTDASTVSVPCVAATCSRMAPCMGMRNQRLPSLCANAGKPCKKQGLLQAD